VIGIFVIPVTAALMLLFFDPAMVVVVTVALYLSLWLLFNPFPALLLYLILMAVRPQEGIVQLEAIHVERLFAVLAILGWGLQAAIHKKSLWLPRGVAGWLFAFVLVCFCSIFTAIWKLGSAEAWIELLKAVVLFFLVSQLVNTPRRLFVMLLVLAFGHIWMAGESLRLYYSEGYDYVRMGIVRATTSSVSRGDPNSLAASLLMAICFGIYTLRSRAELVWRISWLLVIAAGGFVVVLTGSRAAMLAGLFLLFYVWLKSRAKIPVAALAIVLVVVVWLAMPGQYRDRFMTTFDFERNPSAAESARGRITGLTVGAKMFMDRPLLGVGVGNFSVAHATMYSPEDRPSWLQAHNLLAQVVGETGILGVITFAGFVIAGMRLAGRLSNASSHGPPRSGALQSGKTSPASTWADPGDVAFLSSVGTASLGILWLLLFFGLFGHNMMRFNWYLTSGLLAACAGMLRSEKTLPSQEEPEKTTAP